MANDSASLSHTKWNCKYHIVFAQKYRRQEIYGKIKADIGQILRKLCEAKSVEILEAALLVPRVLCGYGRTEQRKDCGIYPQSVTGRYYPDNSGN